MLMPLGVVDTAAKLLEAVRGHWLLLGWGHSSRAGRSLGTRSGAIRLGKDFSAQGNGKVFGV